MTSLTLPSPSGRGAGSWGSGILRFFNGFADGVHDGLELARRYDTLTAMSDVELARIGLRRRDIPQATLRGRGR